MKVAAPAHKKRTGIFLFPCSNFTNEVDLFLRVWSQVAPQDVVEPKFRLLSGRDFLFPRIFGVGLAVNEAPVNRTDIELLQKRKNALEGAAMGPRHILGANQGTIVHAKMLYERLMGVRF